MRGLFTDGFNSFWHFVFGILSFYLPYVFIFFIAYQSHDFNDENISIDIEEFFIGLLCAIFGDLGYNYIKKYKQKKEKTP